MMKKNFWKKFGVSLLAVTMSACLLAGCGSGNESSSPSEDTADSGQDAGSSSQASSEEVKLFYYGDTTFNA